MAIGYSQDKFKKGTLMQLWYHWFRAVELLKPACSRHRTFLWLVVVLAAMTTRKDLAGVTSFVRSHWLKETCYDNLRKFFNTSAIKPDKLAGVWVTLCIKLFHSFLVVENERIVLLADGIKIPKEGKKMPGVKLLHQESESNSKAQYIMGHSCQAISLLVKGVSTFFAAPLISRIHEGIVLSNRSRLTLLDKLIKMLLQLNLVHDFYLVADAYYASKCIVNPLLDNGQHLITRVRTNVVAYEQAKQPQKAARGRPKFYGKKLKLRFCFKKDKMTTAASPVYNESNVNIRYRSMVLIWRPIGKLVQFVLVEHPTRGCMILMTTDLSLEPISVIKLYGLRFKIEVGFRQAVHTIGTFAYHFWMMDMVPIKRRSGNQYLHRKTQEYREQVAKKMDAYHRYIQIGCIVQGLQQYLSVSFPSLVWTHFGSWLRTMKTQQEPSEMVVAHAMTNSFPEFLASLHKDHYLRKFMSDKFDAGRCPQLLLGG